MLDEPSLGLAPLVVREIFRIIERLREQGTSILLIEQNARAALEVSDHGYVLETGAIVLVRAGRAAGRRPARDRHLPGRVSAALKRWASVSLGVAQVQALAGPAAAGLHRRARACCSSCTALVQHTRAAGEARRHAKETGGAARPGRPRRGLALQRAARLSSTPSCAASTRKAAAHRAGAVDAHRRAWKPRCAPRPTRPRARCRPMSARSTTSSTG
jgi:energy-coupling factor transporter ATP-binding protein EcfA2